jgi:hypothetical protein
MIWCLLAVTMMGGPNSREIEQGGVRVRTEIRAALFTYVVTNLACEPIMRLEVPYHNGYDFKVPEGWESDIEGDVFRAWTTDERYSIYHVRTGEFAFRLTSKASAVLGSVELRLEPVTGEPVILRDVWGAVPTPTGYVHLVSAMVLAIFLGHTLLVARSTRRAGGSAMAT